jgi:hypothetical protein
VGTGYLKLMGVVLHVALGVAEKVGAEVHRGCCLPRWPRPARGNIRQVSIAGVRGTGGGPGSAVERKEDGPPVDA